MKTYEKKCEPEYEGEVSTLEIIKIKDSKRERGEGFVMIKFIAYFR